MLTLHLFKYLPKGQWGPCNEFGYFSLVERLSEVLIRNLSSHLQHIKLKVVELRFSRYPSGDMKAVLINATTPRYLH